jgi:hypothetical protein
MLWEVESTSVAISYTLGKGCITKRSLLPSVSRTSLVMVYFFFNGSISIESTILSTCVLVTYKISKSFKLPL